MCSTQTCFENGFITFISLQNVSLIVCIYEDYDHVYFQFLKKSSQIHVSLNDNCTFAL